jgi:hypothetical protein
MAPPLPAPPYGPAPHVFVHVPHSLPTYSTTTPVLCKSQNIFISVLVLGENKQKRRPMASLSSRSPLFLQSSPIRDTCIRLEPTPTKISRDRSMGPIHRVGSVLSFFSRVVRIGTPPTPHPQASVPPQVLGGRVHSLAREGLGESQFRRGVIHCGTILFIFTYFVVSSNTPLPPPVPPLSLHQLALYLWYTFGSLSSNSLRLGLYLHSL